MSRCGRKQALVLGAAALVVVVSIRSGFAGADVPTFGSATEVVHLTVSVTDKSRRFVSGLGRGDFEVLEDGVPQDVVLFSHGTTPLSVALLIDGSSSMRPKLPSVRAAALDLIHSLRAEDEMEIVQFAQVTRVLQEPTTNRAFLSSAVDRIAAEGATSLYDALYVQIKETPRLAAPGEAPIRRAIVVLTDGEDTKSLMTDDQVVELARRADVNVYPIRVSARTEGDPDPQSGRTRHFMTALAGLTGGEPYFPLTAEDLRPIYNRIGDELRSQYNLGYVPRNGAQDRRWRRVTVLPLGHQGLQVRHKAGYFPRGRTDASPENH
jgi:VWFA-related protein